MLFEGKCVIYRCNSFKSNILQGVIERRYRVYGSETTSNTKFNINDSSKKNKGVSIKAENKVENQIKLYRCKNREAEGVKVEITKKKQRRDDIMAIMMTKATELPQQEGQ